MRPPGHSMARAGRPLRAPGRWVVRAPRGDMPCCATLPPASSEGALLVQHIAHTYNETCSLHLLARCGPLKGAKMQPTKQTMKSQHADLSDVCWDRECKSAGQRAHRQRVQFSLRTACWLNTTVLIVVCVECLEGSIRALESNAEILIWPGMQRIP